MTDYDNIPVSKARNTYAKLKMIAESRGFGKRGAGALIDYWVARELPECEHEKTPVTIEIFPSQDTLDGTRLDRTGWYCETCRRVYERIVSGDELVKAELVKAMERAAKARSRRKA